MPQSAAVMIDRTDNDSMSGHTTEELVAKVREALDYYFIPGEHHDRPNREGHAALDRLRELSLILTKIEDANIPYGRLAIGAIARAALQPKEEATCSECKRDLNGYSGPLCRYCDPKAYCE